MNEALAALLDVQAHDARLAQLQHRRSHLPERAERLAVEQRLSALDVELAAPAAQRKAFAAQQQALEDEQRSVTAKIGAAERTLYSGSVSSPRELQALEADITALKRRRAELEDQELEVLVAREPVDARLAAAADEIDTLEGARARLADAIAAIEAEIDTEAGMVAVVRQTRVADVTPALMTIYDRVQPHNGGIGIARLEHGTLWFG